MSMLRRFLGWQSLLPLPMLLVSVGCIVIQSGGGDPCSSGEPRADASMHSGCSEPGNPGSDQPPPPTEPSPTPPSTVPDQPSDPNQSTDDPSQPPPTDPNQPPPDEPNSTPAEGSGSDCLDDCQAYATGVFTECMVLLGDQATCQEHATLAYASCQYGCTDGGSDTDPVPPPATPTPVPPDSDCQTQCQTDADQMLNECLVSGNDPAACKERYEMYLDSCLQSCN